MASQLTPRLNPAPHTCHAPHRPHAPRPDPHQHDRHRRPARTGWSIPRRSGRWSPKIRGRHELVLSNGLARRVIRLAPAAATVAIEDLTTGNICLRAVGPEARVELDGKPFAVGGLVGQPVKNYLKDEWLAALRPDPAAYRFVSWSEGPIEARFAWKRHPEWLSRDLPWPPPGRHLRMTYAPPATGLARG